MGQFTNKSYAREVALCCLYQWHLSGTIQYDELFFDNDKLADNMQYVNNICNYVVNNVEDINIAIANLSVGFALDRIYKYDLSAMQLAIAELSTTDTPVAVVISEVVSLVKKYSTDKSVSFVNGILASYVRNRA